jgi:hypothetical protein
MIRQIHAREQLARERAVRHWQRVGIAIGAVIVAPFVVAAIIRFWAFSVAWIAA